MGEGVKKINGKRQKPLLLAGPPHFPPPEFFHTFGEGGGDEWNFFTPSEGQGGCLT